MPHLASVAELAVRWYTVLRSSYARMRLNANIQLKCVSNEGGSDQLAGLSRDGDLELAHDAVTCF